MKVSLKIRKFEDFATLDVTSEFEDGDKGGNFVQTKSSPSRQETTVFNTSVSTLEQAIMDAANAINAQRESTTPAEIMDAIYELAKRAVLSGESETLTPGQRLNLRNLCDLAKALKEDLAVTSRATYICARDGHRQSLSDDSLCTRCGTYPVH